MDDKICSNPGLAFDGDRTAVKRYDLLGYGKPKPAAFWIFFCVRPSVIPLKQPFLLYAPKPCSVILDREQNAAVFVCIQPNADFCIGRIVQKGVYDKICNGTPESGGIDRNRLFWDFAVKSKVAVGKGGIVDNIDQPFFDIARDPKLFRIKRHRAGI